MSQHFFTKRSGWTAHLATAVSLAFCIALLALTVSRRSDAPGAVLGKVAAKKNADQIGAPKQRVGEDARKYRCGIRNNKG